MNARNTGVNRCGTCTFYDEMGCKCRFRAPMVRVEEPYSNAFSIPVNAPVWPVVDSVRDW